MTEWTGTTIMKSNKIGYFLHEGITSIFNHGFMSFASVCVIIACLLIMGSFSLVAINVNNIIGVLENDNQILAFVDSSYSTEDAMALKAQIESVDNVASADFVSRDTAFEEFAGQYDDTDFLEDLDSEFLRDRYIVYLDDISLMAQTQEALLAVPGIADVNAHLEIAQGFTTIRNVVSVISIILAAILFVVSLFIMSNTIKLTTFERREEIAIMKMVGATSAFIRWPFVVEGLFLGIVGAFIAYVAQWGIYTLIEDRIISSSGLAFMEVIDFHVIAIPLLIAFTVVGLCVGVIGSLVAIKNYLKV